MILSIGVIERRSEEVISFFWRSVYRDKIDFLDEIYKLRLAWCNFGRSDPLVIVRDCINQKIPIS